MAKALYRKYRSKSFDEVVGQEHITDTLKNALSKGAISHAYLFTGPRGVGKTSIARILAYAINNLPYDEEATHLDIIEIDAASNRRIDEIRDLRDKVHIAPTSAKYKVYIIDEVHMLTREAFNALLKTLEEPPEHAVFILATTEAHKVPDTIVSRTQRFTFKPITEQKAIEHLRSIAESENVVIDNEALKLLAQHGGGSFRDSISMLDQLSGLKKDSLNLQDAQMLLGIPNDDLIEHVLRAYEQENIAEIFDSVLALRENGIDSGKAAIHISSKLRSMLFSGTHKLPKDTIIKTLKLLLPATLSSSDYVGLELALIDTAHDFNQYKPVEQQNTSPIPKPEPIVDKKSKPETSKDSLIRESKAEIPKKETKKIDEVADDREIEQEVHSEDIHETNLEFDEGQTDNKTETPKQITNFSTEAWNELLNEIKSKHNTLYGILRMGVAEVGPTGIEITFGFGFHKKQVDTPKNSAIVREYTSKYFGEPNFVTKLDNNKQPKKSPKITSQSPKSDSTTIESVSNIFGGAELLE